MAATSPKSPSPRPELRRGKASENLVASPVKSSPSKSPKPSPTQSFKGGIASPKVKPVKKSQSKGSLKAQAKAGSVMRKPASSIPRWLSDCKLYKTIMKEKDDKWHQAMCAIRGEWEDMKEYNKSFGSGTMTWREFLDFFILVW